MPPKSKKAETTAAVAAPAAEEPAPAEPAAPVEEPPKAEEPSAAKPADKKQVVTKSGRAVRGAGKKTVAKKAAIADLLRPATDEEMQLFKHQLAIFNEQLKELTIPQLKVFWTKFWQTIMSFTKFSQPPVLADKKTWKDFMDVWRNSFLLPEELVQCPMCPETRGPSDMKLIRKLSTHFYHDHHVCFRCLEPRFSSMHLCTELPSVAPAAEEPAPAEPAAPVEEPPKAEEPSAAKPADKKQVATVTESGRAVRAAKKPLPTPAVESNQEKEDDEYQGDKDDEEVNFEAVPTKKARGKRSYDEDVDYGKAKKFGRKTDVKKSGSKPSNKTTARKNVPSESEEEEEEDEEEEEKEEKNNKGAGKKAHAESNGDSSDDEAPARKAPQRAGMSGAPPSARLAANKKKNEDSD